jgi:hypothetical protein
MAGSPYAEIIEAYSESEVELGPIVLKALATLVDGHEKQGQEDVTVIGADRLFCLRARKLMFSGTRCN